MNEKKEELKKVKESLEKRDYKEEKNGLVRLLDGEDKNCKLAEMIDEWTLEQHDENEKWRDLARKAIENLKVETDKRRAAEKMITELKNQINQAGFPSVQDLNLERNLLDF